MQLSSSILALELNLPFGFEKDDTQYQKPNYEVKTVKCQYLNNFPGHKGQGGAIIIIAIKRVTSFLSFFIFYFAISI